MAKTFQLEIVTPEKTALSAPVESVVLPGSEGDLGVLPGHMPLVTALKAGELHFVRDGQPQFLALSGGFAQVTPSKVVVLAETAEMASEIDVHRAQMEAAAKGQKLKGGNLDPDQLAKVQASLMKELVRMRVAEKAKRRN